VLRGQTETARGDLNSAPVHLAPFRWVKVGVEYTVESGSPLLFVCLRPTANRRQVDLEFLPTPPGSEKRKAFVMLHSGALDGDYSVSISLLGQGSARVFVLKAREEGAYPRPTKPAVVIDMPRDGAADQADDGPRNFEKLASLYGFPSIEYVSYTDVTMSKLKALDPGLVLLPPYVTSHEIDRRRIVQAVQVAGRCGAPLIGVGLGHQLLALAEGAEGMDREAEFGPTRLDIVAEDPIFAGLPRETCFFASESHQSIVDGMPDGAEVIATSERVLTQAFRYAGKPWYSFQANLDRGWEFACPESCIVWKNILRQWNLVPPVSGRKR
jgi:GMP synthase-like glutamine amidotransferase